MPKGAGYDTTGRPEIFSRQRLVDLHTKLRNIFQNPRFISAEVDFIDSQSVSIRSNRFMTMALNVEQRELENSYQKLHEAFPAIADGLIFPFQIGVGIAVAILEMQRGSRIIKDFTQGQMQEHLANLTKHANAADDGLSRVAALGIQGEKALAEFLQSFADEHIAEPETSSAYNEANKDAFFRGALSLLEIEVDGNR